MTIEYLSVPSMLLLGPTGETVRCRGIARSKEVLVQVLLHLQYFLSIQIVTQAHTHNNKHTHRRHINLKSLGIFL